MKLKGIFRLIVNDNVALTGVWSKTKPKQCLDTKFKCFIQESTQNFEVEFLLYLPVIYFFKVNFKRSYWRQLNLT